ncbi:MAG: peptidoglycan DD-metalloendopeptidase family protein [Gemmatimonadales bacterium]|nr:peptidoglycan DD-metalloendopeptidase family protein [Gemmatimonadales bacterium]
MRRRSLALLFLGVLLAGAVPERVHAQADTSRAQLEQSRRRLEQIRQERDRLRQQQERLKGQVHDVGEELGNLERQRNATSRLVTEIDRQISGLSSQLDRTSAELILAQDNLAERRAVLERRLAEIYKRGRMYTWQALLAAESFGDLLSRYKYLYLTSQQDKQLLADVELLRARIGRQRDDLLGVRTELDRRRTEREAELRRYDELADERTRRLESLRRSQAATERRLAALTRDQNRLNTVLANLERTRRETATRDAARGVAPSRGTISTADIGKLDWPANGTIVYKFGRDTLPSGGVIRWNGIGIAAAAGTSVTAVEAGTVGLAGNFGTYGLTVVIQHGDGYASVYSHLQNLVVRVGESVTKGQIIAQVGGQSSDYGPHLHFEIRGRNQTALDPMDWLRRR